MHDPEPDHFEELVVALPDAACREFLWLRYKGGVAVHDIAKAFGICFDRASAIKVEALEIRASPSS